MMLSKLLSIKANSRPRKLYIIERILGSMRGEAE